MSSLKLYGYWRSSASWRVRWALEIKKIAFEYVPVNLLKGEHRQAIHLARHPLGQVPVLEIEGKMLSESIAIIDYLDHLQPSPPLFSKDLWQRAKEMELCEVINSGTAPLQTPRVQKRHSADVGERSNWAKDFILDGLLAFAALRPDNKMPFSLGSTVSAPDLFVVPQIYNALRYNVDVAGSLPELFAIYERCLKGDACQKASPENQIDKQ